jgi:predicted metal-dependent enzyme (double-stranded beta helix superfamily)
MFDTDQFIERCLDAIEETEPRRAIKEVLAEVLTSPTEVAKTFDADTGGITMVHASSKATILHIVWPPHMRIFPHDHRMWAAIGIYAGREDNTFFRREGTNIVESGGKTLDERDIALLGDDTIHAVANPLGRYTAAIHVYGGDFPETPRSQWDPETLTEEPYDMDIVRAEFARAEAAAHSTST